MKEKEIDLRTEGLESMGGNKNEGKVNKANKTEKETRQD